MSPCHQVWEPFLFASHAPGVRALVMLAPRQILARLKPWHAMTAGVGAGGLLELRAQVYRTQEHARMVREGDAERPVRRKVCCALAPSPCMPPAPNNSLRHQHLM